MPAILRHDAFAPWAPPLGTFSPDITYIVPAIFLVSSSQTNLLKVASPHSHSPFLLSSLHSTNHLLTSRTLLIDFFLIVFDLLEGKFHESRSFLLLFSLLYPQRLDKC